MKQNKIDYIDRDVSWMYFNHRILEEAKRKDVPVLERMSFLGIYSNNLDEFFRVRVANLKRIVQLGVSEKVKSDLKQEFKSAKDQLKTISQLNMKYAREYAEVVADVISDLKEKNVHIVTEKELDEVQLDFVRNFYREKLMGRISPVWFDRLSHFEKESDDKIYMLVEMSKEGQKSSQHAFFSLPVESVGRWIILPRPKDNEGQGVYVMYLDDLVRSSLPFVFPGIPFVSFEAWTFKFTRDAEMEIDREFREGVMQKISKGVKSRKEGVPLRIVYDASMPNGLMRKIKSHLIGNSPLSTVVAGGRYQNHKDMMSFPNCGVEGLRYPKWTPIMNGEFHGEESIFSVIRSKDRMLHVPYHSFDAYIRLLNEAAINPQVKSIKITLYRLAKNSKVINALICAALNGKKVTVVIELFARFDESSNLDWARQMQEAGIHVIFGVDGLKVHTKLTHIAFSSGQSVACISTGNFHEGNAAVYTDVILMTYNRSIVQEVEKVFRFVDKPYLPIKFKHLLVSPNSMKKQFIEMIDTEINNHLKGKPAYIKMKLNHLTDETMVQKIYEAVTAGVKVEAVVRGNCSLVDDEKFGGRLKVVGIIDRYLEHSRIFIFCNGGEPRYFIGSADWMPRNLDSRIEVVVPVYDPDIQRELLRIVDYGLQDMVQGRLIMGKREAVPSFRSQEALYKYYLNLNDKKDETEKNAGSN